MIFFDIDGTLLDHKGAELEGIKKFYKKCAVQFLLHYNFYSDDYSTFSTDCVRQLLN